MKQTRKITAFILLFLLMIPSYRINAAVSYKLNYTSRTLYRTGSTCSLKVTAPTPYKTSWKSSDTSIATVSSHGIVTAQKKGTSFITCTIRHGKVIKKLSCKIKVRIPAKAITFTNAHIDDDLNAHVIELGSSYDFGCHRISSSKISASSDVIRYYTSDPKKVDVNLKRGIVTPKKTGMTTLTVCAGRTATIAKSTNNKIKQTINLYIKKPEIIVTKCSLKNASQLEIKFKHKMDETTLLKSDHTLSSNISIIMGKNASNPEKMTGTLSNNKTSLFITSSGIFNGSYTLILSSNIQSESGYPLENWCQTMTLKDTIHPTCLGSTIDESGTLVSINFSEPISISNLTIKNPKRADQKVLSYPGIFTDKKNYQLSEDKKSILLNLAALPSADQNTVIEITLYGILDLADNVSQPYPVPIQIYTNTTIQPQAKVVTAYHNGNSIVAQFDKNIQTPGYAFVNNCVVFGNINSENHNEVIYKLNPSTISSLTGMISVTLKDFSTYHPETQNASSLQTIYFHPKADLPDMEGCSFTTIKKDGKYIDELILTFDSNITLNMPSGYLTAQSKSDGIVHSSIPYSYTATSNKKTITIDFQNHFSDLTEYTFKIPAGFATDCYYNQNAEKSLTVTKLFGNNEVLPQPSSIQTGGSNNNFIYITFPNMLDVETAQNKDHYMISGIPIISASIAANAYNRPAIVKLHINPNLIVADAPYQITISNVKGYKGSYSVMKPYRAMITLNNNKTLNVNSKQAFSSTNTFHISFPSPISTSSRIHYTAVNNNKPIEIKSVAINGNTITITFHKKLITDSVITLYPTTDNYILDINNHTLLNTSLSTNVL